MTPLVAVDFGAIIPILFLIIWVISQVVQAVGQQGKGQAPVKGPKQQPGGGRRPQPKGVAQEIEEFLRRAAQQREGGKPAEVEVMRPRAAEHLAGRPPQQGPLKPAAVDRVVEVLPSRDDIAESVEEHLDTGRLERHAELLGDEIRDVDKEVEERLHKKFDRQVGRLATQGDSTRTSHALRRTAPQDVATGRQATAELVELLRNPRGFRNAIIVSEIINRPEHRW